MLCVHASVYISYVNPNGSLGRKLCHCLTLGPTLNGLPWS